MLGFFFEMLLAGPDGRPLPFDRSLIFPYAFRHSYAQRHAHAGIAIDVLKELMDHRDASTTAGYYKVSLKRKRAAVKTMRLHAVDRSGRPAPMISDLAYEARSVAVPFGNCIEPSNVKAGGHRHTPSRGASRMTTRAPADVLRESRRRDSQAKRGKVLAVLEEMVRRGDPVSFAAVARAAGVSHGPWWLCSCGRARTYRVFPLRSRWCRRR
jgi:hypothetical protein